MASDEPSGIVSGEPQKDPRKIARKYQLELCQKAVEENTIVFMGTGCGKTHIAVLLIFELGRFIKRPQKNVCVFLAPTVALVQQQARVVEESSDFNVGICSSMKRLKSHEHWEKEMTQYEVLVMTPAILLHCLSHCFIMMDTITLLIFDECHHAQIRSNHPYAEIMRLYNRTDKEKRPRIFGMTASPVVGKGGSGEESLVKSINSLENLLDAKVYTVEDTKDLDKFVASATVRVYHYGSNSSSYFAYLSKLGELKRECLLLLGRGTEDDLQSRRNTKKLLNRLHDNLIFCLETLGIWGSLQVAYIYYAFHMLIAKAIRILLNHCEWDELIEAEGECSYDSVCDRYLAQAAKVIDSDCSRDGIGSDLSSIEVLNEPYFSSKFLRLVGILSAARLQPNMKCIIFVNRIITARSLSYILQSLEFLASWKCDFLVGIHSGLKSASRQAMKLILEKFRSGELNLLIATKVGEEGLDIQTCCLVIRFDLPETVSSFIQSRGRARMAQSEYAFLVNSGNQKDLDLIESFKQEECRMNVEIARRTSSEVFVGVEERVYQVTSSGASISSAYSVSLLYHYCSKLPHDEYFDPRPKFFFLDDPEGTVCHVVLPSNAPMHMIVGTPQSTAEAAKRDACIEAIENLHKQGSLSDYLLPMQDNEIPEEQALDFSDSPKDERARVEMYEMIVPDVLKEPWNISENPVNFCSYYMEFTPTPADRTYYQFGLFLKKNIPEEIERVKLELNLAHSRTVMTKLVPTGVTEFYEDEIILAEKFQEMILKVILDRMEFVSEFVPLGKKSSPLTFYLLLPVMYHDHENTLNIDWKAIRKCLSSPVFKPATNIKENKCRPSENHLQLHNEARRISDIEGSLVYVPHKKGFYFIANTVNEMNGHSPYDESGTLSYIDNYIQKFNIQLKYPEQPFLRAKPLFNLHNLLHNRNQDESASNPFDEFFTFFPPEVCQLKIIGFSKEMGSSISLLPSIMHRLENLLVAIELKNILRDSFPGGSEISTQRVLEALTTEKCLEGFSLERLEILGDAFLKFSVGRRLFLLHGNLDEGQLTSKRSNAVNNSNLYKLACERNLPVYIRDRALEPSQFFAFGHPCPIVCNEETESDNHSEYLLNNNDTSQIRCSKNHLWLHKKTIADVVEALVGAFIVDSGFKAATAFLKWIGISVDFEASHVTDFCLGSAKFLALTSHIDIAYLEKSLGYSFVHKGLLLQAFVHPSFNKNGGGCYQRLEYLGDAVLDYLMTSYLYSVYLKLKPGQLTDLRSAFVNNQAFASVAVDRSFQKFLICDSKSLSKAVKNYVEFITAPSPDTVNSPKCPKALGDLVESCVGAILVDTGFDLDRVWKVMLSFLNPIMSLSTLLLNPTRELLELCQTHSWGENLYSVQKKGNMYLVEAKVESSDFSVTASAINTSIKEAKKITAEQLLIELTARGYTTKSMSSLETVLKSTPKMEARLIGYDEIPIDVTLFPNPSQVEEDQTLQAPSIKRFVSKVRSPNEQATTSSSCNSIPNSGTFKDDDHDVSYTNAVSLKEKTAKSRLSELCTANCWKPPTFECCGEDGPSHLKTFTYKVIVEIEEGPEMVLECHSSAYPKKKAAAEHAAQGALWFLEKQGYL